MPTVLPNLGIQSWCFRQFKPLPAFLAELRKAGVTATELCGVHADFARPETFAGTVAACRDAGVAILSIGVNRLTADEAKARPLFEFCRAAGCRTMSVTFAPDGLWAAFRLAEKLADEFDLRLGIHNHGGYDWLGNATMLDYIFAHTSPRIGLTLDTAWALDAKQDPIALVQRYAARLHGLHIKDFVFDRARNPADVIVGTGNLDLPKLLAALRQSQFAGFAVLEYEADEHDPVPALARCVQAVQAAEGVATP